MDTFCGIRLWCNRSHDLMLASEIISGHRPEIVYGTPDVYIQLMTQCWHSDPLKRPAASQLYETIGNWIDAIDDPNPSELSEQFEKDFPNLERNKFHQQIHYQAFYTSRFFHFSELFDHTKNDFTEDKIPICLRFDKFIVISIMYYIHVIFKYTVKFIMQYVFIFFLKNL